MPGEAVATLTAQVTKATEVQKGATILINGFTARLDAAVAAAIANGATAAELVPLTDLSTQMHAETQNLAAAIEANTPAARNR